MYLAFFGLKEKPFSVTPDPKFLCLTRGHREALAQLLYGVQEQKGFIVLTGDIGTGKTTLLHMLRQRFDGNTAVSFIFNSTLPLDLPTDVNNHASDFLKRLDDLGQWKPVSVSQSLLKPDNKCGFRCFSGHV